MSLCIRLAVIKAFAITEKNKAETKEKVPRPEKSTK